MQAAAPRATGRGAGCSSGHTPAARGRDRLRLLRLPDCAQPGAAGCPSRPTAAGTADAKGSQPGEGQPG
ncbi:hypothetical protein HaLaN_29373 [Haematococcus lacustris]|uniref:Uncharacterized protein n=1 Tax=Haematococcus lacustris TaxID=44745 RepID=A0A6A0AD30_HAELA|nr:hypothetical protein HaLaN_29373 [Haematococcus lacustris]